MAAIVFTRAEAKLLRAGYTEDQVLMRREMEQGLHKRQPETLGDVINTMMGFENPDTDVRDEALVLIKDHGADLTLNMKQWAVVQRLVEAGIVSGRAGS